MKPFDALFDGFQLLTNVIKKIHSGVDVVLDPPLKHYNVYQTSVQIK